MPGLAALGAKSGGEAREGRAIGISTWHIVVLELSAWALIVAGLVTVVLAARRFRRWTIVPALPLVYAFVVVSAWLIVETTWMRSWATKDGAVLSAEDGSLTGEYTVEVHKGQPVVTTIVERQGRRGVVRESGRFYSPPLWFVESAAVRVGPVATGMLAIVYVAVPRRRVRGRVGADGGGGSGAG